MLKRTIDKRRYKSSPKVMDANDAKADLADMLRFGQVRSATLKKVRALIRHGTSEDMSIIHEEDTEAIPWHMIRNTSMFCAAWDTLHIIMVNYIFWWTPFVIAFLDPKVRAFDSNSIITRL